MAATSAAEGCGSSWRGRRKTGPEFSTTHCIGHGHCSGAVPRRAEHGEKGVANRHLRSGVECDKRYVVCDRKCPADLFHVVDQMAVKDVDADHERKADLLEVVDGGVTVVETPGVDDDEGA